MAADESRIPLAGSERSLVPNATRVGAVAADEPITVTVLVRPRPDAVPVDSAEVGARPSVERERLPRESFAAARGASAADLARVEEFARDSHLAVVESSPERRSVQLSGRAEDVCAAFGVELSRYVHPDGAFRGRTGPVYLPSDLADVVEGVFGLDDRSQAHPRFQIADPAAVASSFTPPEVAALYRFPDGGTGVGECIAIIELGGGYEPTDLESYFSELGLSVPEVVAVEVDGGRNAPTGDPNSADAEVLLDIEVAGSIAHGARIAVYFAPNTDQGFIDAVSTAVHDTQNAPSVLSISWGAPERNWTAQAQRALDRSFADAASLGVTVCVACGDNGAADNVHDGRAHVDFPASSPHALACGGTTLRAGGDTISAETVWNDGNGGATGGGISETFDLPIWQEPADIPASVNGDGRVGRGVPDVAGDADPATGYTVLVDGQQTTIGGTSAVAPLWAALIALLNERLGAPLGYVNPLLYRELGGDAFRDVTSGDNSVPRTPGYAARAGWDACTGLGTPDGQALLATITTQA
jgi:kumamolisin